MTLPTFELRKEAMNRDDLTALQLEDEVLPVADHVLDIRARDADLDDRSLGQTELGRQTVLGNSGLLGNDNDIHVTCRRRHKTLTFEN